MAERSSPGLSQRRISRRRRLLKLIAWVSTSKRSSVNSRPTRVSDSSLLKGVTCVPSGGSSETLS